MAPIRAPAALSALLAHGRRRSRLALLSALVVALVFLVLTSKPGGLDLPTPSWTPTWTPSWSASPSETGAADDVSQGDDAADHPIDHLMRAAKRRFNELLATRSLSLADAAARYRERRGRHPPPGFDAWFAQAQRDDAVVVEAFFDRIYDDIRPFWALNPQQLRKQAHDQPQVIRVRGGKVDFITDDANRQPWIQHWTDLVREMGQHLPDLDMAVNIMDESRILVPWEVMAAYVRTEQATRRIVDPSETTATYSGLADVDGGGGGGDEPPYDARWITDAAPKYWDHLRVACPPDSPGRNVSSLASFDGPVEYPSARLPYTREGFVGNATAARDVCLQPHLRGMHGTFIESVSMSTTHALMPMFGGSKLPQNNEMLIPGAMYLSDREFYNGGGGHGPAWARKRNSLVWRGTASGGRNKHDNWWHFHRHRWVQAMNATAMAALEAGDASRAPAAALPAAGVFAVSGAQARGRLGAWLAAVADVAFVNLECFPAVTREAGLWPFGSRQTAKDCAYTSPYMGVRASAPMREQYAHKLLPDVDGNSFSARWRAFLQSTSLPLKATIYAEWHDDRLEPWLHYVPFDNTFGDVYAVAEYLLAHDDAAAGIAAAGKAWAERAYRRADMKLYVWRLLLEYARVVDDARDRLAFVGDL